MKTCLSFQLQQTYEWLGTELLEIYFISPKLLKIFVILYFIFKEISFQ